MILNNIMTATFYITLVIISLIYMLYQNYEKRKSGHFWGIRFVCETTSMGMLLLAKFYFSVSEWANQQLYLKGMWPLSSEIFSLTFFILLIITTFVTQSVCLMGKRNFMLSTETYHRMYRQMDVCLLFKGILICPSQQGKETRNTVIYVKWCKMHWHFKPHIHNISVILSLLWTLPCMYYKFQTYL